MNPCLTRTAQVEQVTLGVVECNRMISLSVGEIDCEKLRDKEGAPGCVDCGLTGKV
jgi:hypothetical protein